MFEPYLMGQYQYPWQGMTPMPNWQPQAPQAAQGQQGIQGVRFVSAGSGEPAAASVCSLWRCPLSELHHVYRWVQSVFQR